MSDNLRGNDTWARWRWNVDGLFKSWPLIVLVSQGPRLVLQACRTRPDVVAVNDNEQR